MGRLALPNFKRFHEYILFKLVWYWHKKRKLFNAAEGADRSPNIGRTYL